MPRWKLPSPSKSCAPAAHCANVVGGPAKSGRETHSADLSADGVGLDCALPWVTTVVRQRADNTLPSSRRNRLISLPVTSLVVLNPFRDIFPAACCALMMEHEQLYPQEPQC